MNGGRGRLTRNGDAGPGCGASIDQLLDQAVAAINRGDRAAGTALAEQVLAADRVNAEAEDLLAAPANAGEIRRLTILFADLADSTELSSRIEPEGYRMLVGRYRDLVHSMVHRFEGHVSAHQGDGILAIFGHPTAHEDDARRAVLAALEISRRLAGLSEQAQRRFGVGLGVRVGVHRGLAYLDTANDDVYGLAANVAARVSGLASPGAVVVSESVALLIRNTFELEARPPAAVKGVDGLITHHLVVDERAQPAMIVRCPLVGRDRELAHLKQSWARTRKGASSTPGVVFRGEPGIGKSRLAAAAAELVEDSGAAVLELTGSPFHPDTGLHPVRTLIERRCGISRLTEPSERLRLLDAEMQACGLDPETDVRLLAPVLGIGAEAGYQPMPAEGRKLYGLIAQAVQRYLMACLDGGNGLVVAEDVHWFDASTLDVLAALLQASHSRLLVVLTGRPGSWLPAGWPVTVFDLTPLTEAQTLELIAALDSSLTPDDRAAVADRCDGVPFYIEQVVAGLSQTGVPEALHEPLFARLQARAKVVPVLEAAAVLGRQIDRALLGSVVDLPDIEVDDVINELEDALVLERWGTDGWRFRHELLREVAAELAPPSVRSELHAKVADALIGLGSGERDWPLVAAHYGQAEQFDKAAAAYQQASTDARRRGALAEAHSYLSVALAQLDRAKPCEARDRRELSARLERGFITAAGEGQQSNAAAADFERCLQLAGTDLRDDELFATLNALTGYYAGRADLQRTEQVLELLRAGIEGRPWYRSVIDVEYGVLAWLRGEFDAARFHFEQATADLAAPDRDLLDAMWFVPSEPIGTAHLHTAWAHMVRGDLPGADAALALAARRATELGFPQGPYMHAYTKFIECWISVETGRLDRAAVLASELDELAERHGYDFWQLMATTWHATVGALRGLDAKDDAGGLAAHAATMTATVESLRSLDVNAYLTFFDSVVARLLIAAGQPQQARRHLDTALQLAEDTGMHFYDAELLRLRARTLPDLDARHAELIAARDLARGQGATVFELRAALDDFELRAEPTARSGIVDAASRIPDDSACPELAQARGIVNPAT